MKKKARRWKNPEDKGATLIRRSGGTRARLCKAWVSQESRSKERVSRKNFILFTERGFLARVCCNDGPHGFPRRSTMWRSRRGAWKEQGRRFSATELSSRALSFRRPINVGQPTRSSLSKPASLASHNEKGTSLNQRRCMEENRERERGREEKRANEKNTERGVRGEENGRKKRKSSSIRLYTQRPWVNASVFCRTTIARPALKNFPYLYNPILPSSGREPLSVHSAPRGKKSILHPARELFSKFFCGKMRHGEEI